MRTGTISILLLALSATARAQVTRPSAAAATRLAPATQPATRPAEVVSAAWRGLRYLGHHQDPSGGWGQFTVPRRAPGPLRPDIFHLPPPPPYFPPNVAETSAVVLAFLDAGQSPATGQPAAGPLAMAMNFLHREAVTAPFPPEDAPLSGLVGRCAVTRTMLNPCVDPALALEAMLTYHRRLGIAATNAGVRVDYDVLLAKLKDNQNPDGSWPIDPKVQAVLDENARDFAKGVGTDQYYRTFPRPVPILGDALIVRAMILAARAGLTVDRQSLDAAKAHLMETYDPLTGDVGGEGEHAFYRAAAQLNLLYQDAVDAPPKDVKARVTALNRARARFFEKLRAVNTSAAGLKPKNPLEGGPGGHRRPDNPLDVDGPLYPQGPATGPTAATQPYRAPVPISSVDMAAYFLLLESLQDSTLPQARELYDQLTRMIANAYGGRGRLPSRDLSGLASRPKDGWLDASASDALAFHWALLGGIDTDNPNPIPANHLVTALAIRVMALPPPPLPPPPRSGDKK